MGHGTVHTTTATDLTLALDGTLPIGDSIMGGTTAGMTLGATAGGMIHGTMAVGTALITVIGVLHTDITEDTMVVITVEDTATGLEHPKVYVTIMADDLPQTHTVAEIADTEEAAQTPESLHAQGELVNTALLATATMAAAVDILLSNQQEVQQRTTMPTVPITMADAQTATQRLTQTIV